MISVSEYTTTTTITAAAADCLHLKDLTAAAAAVIVFIARCNARGALGSCLKLKRSLIFINYQLLRRCSEGDFPPPPPSEGNQKP